MLNTHLVVVGGGSAGWLTALYARAVLPHAQVTVIESEEIGILGAGEGTTPAFVGLLDFLQIPVSDLIRETGATIKNGIRFANWKNDGEHYYHAFAVKNNLGFEGALVHERSLSTYASFISNSNAGEPLNSIDIVAKASDKNKVLFTVNPAASPTVSNPIFNYTQHSDFALHFDASKLALFLKDVGLSRGISRVEGKVSSLEEDDDGNIIRIHLESGQSVGSDFVFDCTGFHRLIIGKHYGAEWKSHSDKLPVNAALPFFLPQDEEIPAYTDSIAMNYGWMWKIPLQHRYGCGYVYDSSLISAEEARKEIIDYLGFEPEFPRPEGFKFNAGYYKTPWVKNCIAVGLASGFIEPLEATSIWVSIMELENILTNVEHLYLDDQRIKDEFNKKFQNISEQVVDFVYFHYMSGRIDTDFWEKFEDVSKAPTYIQELLATWDYRLPQFSDHYGKIWTVTSWQAIAHGIGRANKELEEYSSAVSPAQQYGDQLYLPLRDKQDAVVEAMVDHRTFIDKMF